MTYHYRHPNLAIKLNETVFLFLYSAGIFFIYTLVKNSLIKMKMNDYLNLNPPNTKASTI